MIVAHQQSEGLVGEALPATNISLDGDKYLPFAPDCTGLHTAGHGTITAVVNNVERGVALGQAGAGRLDLRRAIQAGVAFHAIVSFERADLLGSSCGGAGHSFGSEERTLSKPKVVWVACPECRCSPVELLRSMRRGQLLLWCPKCRAIWTK